MMNCSICGKPLGPGEEVICEACKEQIRAEVLGERENIRRESERITKGKEYGSPKKARISNQQGEREEQKKPLREFRSLAEYLEYLRNANR